MFQMLGTPAIPSNSVPGRHVISGKTMGTRYSVVFYSEFNFDAEALQRELQEAVDRVDEQMSPWKADSILCEINRMEPASWIDLPDETFEVCEAALLTCVESEGAFDPFVGDLVSAWGFGPETDAPDLSKTKQLQGDWNSRKREVEFDRKNRRLRRPASCRLDLCGIAKGYGVDRLSLVMHRWGLPDHLVSIDGELRASGRKAGGSGWQVALEAPEANVRREALRLEVSDVAIATSGTYRKSRNAGGRTVSHTMNPQSGAPVNNELLSVSVIAETCMTADAWATAYMVMGCEKALAHAQHAGLDAIFVVRTPLGAVDVLATDPELLSA